MFHTFGNWNFYPPIYCFRLKIICRVEIHSTRFEHFLSTSSWFHYLSDIQKELLNTNHTNKWFTVENPCKQLDQLCSDAMVVLVNTDASVHTIEWNAQPSAMYRWNIFFHSSNNTEYLITNGRRIWRCCNFFFKKREIFYYVK